ncbi:MAG TPA: amino acid adenylation domain-containing protein [Chthonomonadaceae bacterium]|nr:amino acid adenylation domain-containing protein [Chthonomonadaceae bacterium]
MFRRELTALYNAYSTGSPSPLPDLPIQYADYAAWQRNWLQGEVLERQIGYWKERLTGAPPVLELPTDRPRPAIQTFRGAFLRYEFSPELSRAIKQLAQQEGATYYMTLLAAFNVLLSRYSGQDDIVVGSPIANRTQAELEGLIGFFVNSVPLRTDLSGDPSFVELLGRVREMALGAYAHQDLPFEKLVEELQPERNLSHSPIFQILFSMQNAPRGDLDLQGIRLRSIDSGMAISKFDMTLAVSDRQDQFVLWLEYNTDLFDAERMQRLLEHLRLLLEGIVADPKQEVARLPLLTQPERRQILTQWNDTHRPYPRERCFHQLFEEQVARTPEAVAVECQGQSLTYAQLNAKANQLARYLQMLGVGPEVLVGLCLPRSLEMVIGMLGILKAGGAYVPLDPSYPLDRLAFMIEDAQTAVLLSLESCVDALPSSVLAVVCLDRDWPMIGMESETDLLGALTPEHAAYVIYTSGTTGRPKGAVITQGGLTNYLTWCVDAYEVASGQGSPVHSSLSFDLTVTSLMPALLVGRTAWLLPESEGVSALSDALQTQQDLSLVKITPAHLELLSQQLPRGQAADRIRAFIIGGEALSGESLLYWRENAPQTRIVNEYGPTETVVGCCVYSVMARDCPSGAVPIGRPIANTELYLLDRWRQPVPQGVPGELYIGGAGVARGYLNRPDLTAEKFVPDPFRSEPGARMYRTGDLCRLLPDGNLEFVARLDQQVKIRGYRIELGEIESALLGHSGVREAVVLAREDVPGDKRLVAYVVGQSASVSVAALQEHLLAKLPEYMVPSGWVVLERLPLTPNGKVDRKALPAPHAQSAEASYVAPRTPIEEGLAEIWSEVLRLDQVGVHSSFFDLGGHSLLATQVISRIRTIFAVELPLRVLFETPTIAGLAAHIAGTSGSGASSAPGLVRVSREGRLPLSFAQQRLWFIDQLEPDSSAYHIPLAVRLRGSLDISALEQSLNTLVERHEALRTVFASPEGEPVQVIQEYAPFALPLTDLNSLTAETREAEVRRLVQEEAQRPFDLAAGPLFRAALLQLAEEEHVLLLTLHHIVSDGWSQGVLTRELTALYNAYRSGQPSPLTELSIQYADYAAWQRQWLQAEELQRQVGYWKQHLAGAPALLELPTDRSRPAIQSYRGARLRQEFSPELTSGLKALCQQEGVTLFMTLLAAFQTLLSRYSGQDDIVVGTPIANRTQAEIEGLIGFFVNTLALRTDLSGDPGFVEVLKRVREVCLGGYAHQDLPFEKLVEEIQPQRSMSHSPLFQVLFSLANAPRVGLDLEGLEVGRAGSEGVSAKFDLSLVMWETGGKLGGALEYNTDLFDAERMQRMLGHFQVLLEAIVLNAQQKLSALPLMTAAERHQVLTEWNSTEVAYPRQRCIHELFEAQVERAPEAIAVEFEGASLTYRALNQRANQLAHYLQKLGVGPEMLVGVFMERSLEMVVTLLGILKAGGAYVPLDSNYPQERIAFMLEDSRTPILLTQQHLKARLGDQKARILCVNTEGTYASESVANPQRAVLADNLAYVIYTSGSTGRPKGVEVSHSNLLNLVHWHVRTYNLGTADRTTQVARSAFDASVWEIWPSLAVGASLYIANEETTLSSQELLGWLAQHEATVCFLPTPLAEMVLADPGCVDLHLRALLTGGDRLHPIAQPTLPFELINHYGPTESTVVATAGRVALNETEGAPSIGRPISNTQVYLLDAGMSPVAVGVSGELYIGGESLARGYLNRPELTAERFVPNPFSSVPGARLYRTGDLCRYLRDGNIEFVGRADDQVKIRGFRIELGEIESVLSQHPAIREAAVLAREDTPGGKRLVAYVVSRDGTASVGVLRAHLADKLPGYMVPSMFVYLEALPLSPNGKIDRKALPAPEAQDVEEAYVAPRTPHEEGLAEIWSEILHLERVGIHDSFFDLGGHSLLATQVILRIRTTFEVELPLRALFETPTVAGLATHIAAASGASGSGSPALVRVSREGRLPLSFAQQRLWFIDQLEPGSSLYNIPMALRLTGRLDVSALEASLNTLVERHEALRTVFWEAEGDPVQIIQSYTPFELPVTDLAGISLEEAREAEMRRLVQEEAQRPFELSVGPLFRSALLKLGEEEHVLLLTLHHIVSDGWSQGVLMRELTALYKAYHAGQPSPLSALPIQYADYAAWQRNWLQGEELDRQIEYWKEQMAGAPPLLRLRTGRPVPGVSTYSGGSERLVIAHEDYAGLSEFGRQEKVTQFMTLFAAFNVLLYRYSGQTDLVVGTDSANRNHADTEGLIGFFLNHLVLRTDLAGNPTFREIMDRVREVCLGAYSHQSLPFDKLVEVLRPERSTSHTPLFQVLFVMNPPAHRMTFDPSLSVSYVNPGMPTAKYDIVVFANESAGALSTTWLYQTDLFEAITIRGMAADFEAVIRYVASNPDAHLLELETMLLDLARKRLKSDRNEGQGPIRSGRQLGPSIPRR